MSEKDYMDADYEVISMVNRARGGRLPRATLTFIPTERAERVEELDLRIRQLQKIAPYIGAAVLAIAAILIGRAM